MLELTDPHEYYTTLDRAGLALAVGGLASGVLAVVLAALGGGHSPAALALMLILGTTLAATLIAAVAGPIWIICHKRGWRGPFAAATVGAAIGFVLFLAGQTYGIGLYDMPDIDTPTLVYRWLSGIATSAVLALITGGIGLAMWRVAYRKV